jgi:hypothetical protein
MQDLDEGSAIIATYLRCLLWKFKALGALAGTRFDRMGEIWDLEEAFGYSHDVFVSFDAQCISSISPSPCAVVSSR